MGLCSAPGESGPSRGKDKTEQDHCHLSVFMSPCCDIDYYV